MTIQTVLGVTLACARCESRGGIYYYKLALRMMQEYDTLAEADRQIADLIRCRILRRVARSDLARHLK